MGGPDKTPILRIEGLQTQFETSMGPVYAVDDIDLSLRQGETLGLVGESGSGKTATALSIMGLIPQPPGRIVGGLIYLDGIGDLLKLSEEEMRRIRGKHIAMTFQDPLSYLNPVFRVGYQIVEAILLHQQPMSRSQAKDTAVELLRSVGISSPDTRVNAYPHQLSGGMRQRVLLAIALACQPRVLIADEFTTALDVITQYEILRLLEDLVQRQNLTLMIITHDLGIAAELCDRIAIMYAGRIMEIGSTRQILEGSKNPYTRALLRAIPSIDQVGRRVQPIEGSIPSLLHPPSGCRFHPRCRYADDICLLERPPLEEISDQHFTLCHFWRSLNNTEDPIS